MTTFAHVECPSCGWESLADPQGMERLQGCHVCGGPVVVGISPLPWHHGALVRR